MNLGTVGRGGGLGTRFVALTLGVSLIVGGLGACSDDDSDDDISLVPTEGGTADTTEPGDTGGEPGGPASRALTGTWEGTYACGSAESGLTLVLDDRGGGVAASFGYHPGDGSGGSTGRYSMTGMVADGQLTLTGDVWQEPREEDGGGDQPMVGLEAAVGDRPDTEQIEGTVVGEGCTTFSVERTSTDPWYVGTFRGAYGCNQGVTGVDLTLEDLGDRAVGATFDFYAVAENPDVPSGSYRMEGTYVAGEMVLHGVEWIEQPEGYVMVDLRLFNDYGVDPETMYGVIQDSGAIEGSCTVFGLTRVEGPADS